MVSPTWDVGAQRVDVGGAVWSLPHGGDLDANLVCLAPGGSIGLHVNNEVDVLVLVRSGSGSLHIDDERFDLRDDVVALIPKGTARSIEAGAAGIAYVTVHQQRGPLTITPRGMTTKGSVEHGPI